MTIINPLTKQTIINYAKIQDHKRVTSIDGLESANCAASNTRYEYDANGFKDKETDAEDRITTYINDARGHPERIIEGFGTAEARITNLQWDPALNLPTRIAAPRLTSNMTYESGRLSLLSQIDTTVPAGTEGRIRSWVYNYCLAGDTNCPVGLLKSVNGPLAGTGDTVAYRYDATGFVSTITNEVGHVTAVISKNPSGQPTRIRDANNVDTDLTYDERNRLKTVTIAGAVTTYDYFPNGMVRKITRGDGSFLQYTYNGANRVTRITNNAGEKIEFGYNANGDVESRTVKTSADAIVLQQTQAFDELGRLLRQVGAASQTATFGYDKTDLLKTVTDPRSTLFSYAYDGLKRLVSETGSGAVVNYGLDAQDNLATYTDPRSIATTYVRNGFGEMISETSPDSGVTTYTRDALGNVTQMSDGRNIVTEYTYDDAGRMLTKSFPAAPAEDIVYTWDSTAATTKGWGRLSIADDQPGYTSWLYDGRGNITRENRVVQAKTYATLYQYDNGDNLTQITYPSGRIVTLSRNALGQVSGITTKRNATSASINVAASITWSAMSDLVTGFTFGNGLSFQAIYDADYRLFRLKLKDGATDLLSRAHIYADGVNLTRITDFIDAGQTQNLGYTPLNQLQSAAGAYGAYTYTYDLTGNRRQENKAGGPAKVLNYPAATNRPFEETTGGTPTRTFIYDGAGNTTRGLPAGGVYTLDYNKRNRPSALRQSGTVVAIYLFNAQEQLVSRSVTQPTAGATHYIYDTQGYLIAEATGTSAATAVITREYIWLEGLPVMVVDGVNTASPINYWVHTDHLTRPIRMTNAAKATVWSATWLPWGGAHAITGTAIQNQRFPGQYFLIEQGLAYNWHRFYDATTGRYTQPDPLGFPDGPARYAYALNSPLMYTDRDGLYTEVIIWSPVGYGKSSFGHTSVVINGRNFSFGERGWDRSYPTAQGYANLNNFRSGFGYELNFNDEQEKRFMDCLIADQQNSKPYDPLENSCVSPVQRCLKQAGAGLDSYNIVFPSDLGDALVASGNVKDVIYYPKMTLRRR